MLENTSDFEPWTRVFCSSHYNISGKGLGTDLDMNELSILCLLLTNRGRLNHKVYYKNKAFFFHVNCL